MLAGLFAMLLGLACLALAHAAAERHDLRKKSIPVEIGPAAPDYVPSEPRKNKSLEEVSTMFARAKQ